MERIKSPSENKMSNERFAPDAAVSLRDILYILFRHKWKLISFFLLVSGSVTVFTFHMPEIYQSDAKLLIQIGRESVSVDPAVVGPTMSVSQVRENEVNSELAILRSRILAENVVDRIGPERFQRSPEDRLLPAEFYGICKKMRDICLSHSGLSMTREEDAPHAIRDEAIKKMMKNLEVGVEKKSHIINLSFQAQAPGLAKNTLATLLDAFLERHIAVHRTQASPRFFQEQSEKLLKKLREKEKQLEQFLAQNDTASIDQHKALLFKLRSETDDALKQIYASQAKIASLKKSLRGRSEFIEISRVEGKANPAVNMIKDRLIDLRLREAELSAKYSDDFRPLADVREQIRLAEEAIAREKETLTEVTIGSDTTYQSIQLSMDTEKSRLRAYVALKKNLEAELAAREAELAALVNEEMILTRLKRDVRILETDYLKYRDNLQRARISTALDMDKVSNVSIVQPATEPLDPVKPNKKLYVVLGIFLGLSGGIGLVFFLDFFDNSLRTDEDVEKRLDLPVLAVISCEEFESCLKKFIA
ncbi:LPS biosynthesis protein [Desulfonema ishimotonii]|uniref:LPS biosynthesis protein n=1 Tax=Desulfonema ishimotonii TaxID=45657 RepID=A0A401G3I7_9BACT|nr:GumC family protein [Desulfonema ishimotonii]GBC63776.1 LPS biosynthesis protein [Desulfonema ishimotonii]